MKKYEVTLTAHYEKTISVYADSPEEAEEKLKTVLFGTDLVTFSEEDFVCGEADIADAGKTEAEEADIEDECLEHEGCSGCPYFCPVCGECMYEDAD
ncbi:MAG: hypothetical protein NC311_16770 [Muribaculaceae bacterium]|nr:hypothetical protein [Lachnospiraceae bacterium]MCM1231803.1 hypothetical protein [Ruminococcus flavefaciens]MCM1297196.1 hypothetical protein [Muribaculaceae bacterium]